MCLFKLTINISTCILPQSVVYLSSPYREHYSVVISINQNLRPLTCSPLFKWRKQNMNIFYHQIHNNIAQMLQTNIVIKLSYMIHMIPIYNLKVKSTHVTIFTFSLSMLTTPGGATENCYICL